jgi:hypothetical protein
MPKVRSKKRRLTDKVSVASSGGYSNSSTASSIAVINPNSKFLEPEVLKCFNNRSIESPAILSERKVSYHPLTPMDENNSQVEVFMNGSATDFTRPSGIMQKVTVKVTKADGDALEAADVVKLSLPWGGMHGIWMNQQIWINEVVVDDSNSLHIHRCNAYLLTQKWEHHLDNELLLAGVHMEPPHVYEVLDKTKSENSKAKQEAMKESHLITWVGKIISPITETPHLFPPMTSIRIKWTKAPVKQILHCNDTYGENYKFHFVSCELIVPKLKLDPEVAMAFETTLHREPAKYPMRRWVSTYLSLPQSISRYSTDGYMSGDMPMFTICALTNADSFVGSYFKSPTRYETFNLRSIKICLEEESEIREAIKMTDLDHTQPVLALLEGLNILHNTDSARNCVINRETFMQGEQLFFFNHCNDSRVNPDVYQGLKRGNMRFQLELERGHDKPIVVLFHSIFQAEMKIYGDRRVMFENQ